MFNVGDKVKIKPEWQDNGDDLIEFVVVEEPIDGRLTIEAQIGLCINPTYRIELLMLEPN